MSIKLSQCFENLSKQTFTLLDHGHGRSILCQAEQIHRAVLYVIIIWTLPLVARSIYPRDIFIRGARGALPPPLNFDNPNRSKMLYVTCGTIIGFDFWIFFKYF